VESSFRLGRIAGVDVEIGWSRRAVFEHTAAGRRSRWG
jgi:hypothetical protein